MFSDVRNAYFVDDFLGIGHFGLFIEIEGVSKNLPAIARMLLDEVRILLFQNREKCAFLFFQVVLACFVIQEKLGTSFQQKVVDFGSDMSTGSARTLNEQQIKTRFEQAMDSRGDYVAQLLGCSQVIDKRFGKNSHHQQIGEFSFLVQISKME